MTDNTKQETQQKHSKKTLSLKDSNILSNYILKNGRAKPLIWILEPYMDKFNLFMLSVMETKRLSILFWFSGEKRKWFLLVPFGCSCRKLTIATPLIRHQVELWKMETHSDWHSQENGSAWTSEAKKCSRAANTK